MQSFPPEDWGITMAIWNFIFIYCLIQAAFCLKFVKVVCYNALVVALGIPVYLQACIKMIV